MRVAFAGTPEFAAEALRALDAASFTLVLVLTQPDRPSGRGLRVQASPVKQLAQALGVPILQPRSLRLDGRHPADAHAAQRALQAAQPDALVVAAYGLILPEWVLALPRHGCLNIHASLLPRWRGAAPIQRAIEAGDSNTGVTIMQMDAGLDTGPTLLREDVPISAADTSATLHDKLAGVGGRLVVQALNDVATGRAVRTPQPTEGVTYAAKVDKAEARIDWTGSAQQIERRVRAFDPAPGTSLAWRGESIKLWRARVLAADAAPGTEPGATVDVGPGRLAFQCGRGILELLEVQRPGGRRISVAQFLQATQGQVATRR